jgi:DNA-binding IclR family transcriptional regulator
MTTKSREIKNIAAFDTIESSESFMTRVSNVLMCLSKGVNNLTDIAKRCNLNPSTTHRILGTLKKPGFIIYDTLNHRYYLGPQIAKLSSNPVTSHQYLILLATNEMKRLSTIIGETVTLSTTIGFQYVGLHSVHSKNRLIIFEQYEGNRPVLPIGCTEKTLLSQFNDDELRLALGIGKRWQTKDNVIPDIEGWQKELAQIKKQGYAISHGEIVPGALGISVAVKNYPSPVALTIIAPKYQVESREQYLIKELTESAERLSKDLLELLLQ